jgi:alkanesulfonate monooxygenase SsuD/methylene tetrahydromethanopterin reductase-like flavin-dependent oxidoreductase (luciferase family)
MANPTASTSSAGRCWRLGEATERVEIGALVTCNSYRNPQLLADMARTVDHISDGRLILGIGSGWFEKDYDQYGYEFGTAGGRLDALARTCPDQEPLGKAQPAPDQGHPGADRWRRRAQDLRIVAEHADIWHGFGEADQVAHKHRVLDEWCAKVGRNPWRSNAPRACRSRTRSSAESLYAVGTRLFTVGLGGPAYDLGPLRDLLSWRDSDPALLVRHGPLTGSHR